MEKIQVNVSQLLLDLENPRIVSADTQPDALRSMIEFDPRHFKTMMESIKDHGLDPGDAFYVIASETDPDEFIVMDGNRRLAALMALRLPSLLQGIPISANLRQKLSAVAKGYDAASIEEVDAVIFDDRAAADEWILRRHGRGMEGEARIYWGPLEIQRFQRDRTVLDVIEFVKKNSTFGDDEWTRIEEKLTDKASVLRRFLEAKPIRELLGLTVTKSGDETIPEFSSTPATAIEVLSAIVSDVADGSVTTRTHNKKENFEEYVADLPDHLKKSKRGAKAVRFRDATVSGKGTRPRQKAKPTTTPQPVKRTTAKPPRITLAPRSHRFAAPSSEKAERLLFEASKISLKVTPLACAYVLRAFIENTIDGYIADKGISDWNAAKNQRYDLKHRSQIVMDHLVAAGVAKKDDLRSITRILTNSTDPASIQALNDYIHGKYHVPSIDAVRNVWDVAEPLFIAVYGSAK
ncbi:MAG: hypothetical protein EOR12_22995 [Mesorhizobium sp.]|uniref:hypothetical protein n=1 Tax=Mesorhizobium sp. TaxID=1871066 RepID=UPI000FE5F8E2|nr:hypothetical protein [Mesorhizobium sp.]RWP86337.1 MAG: hypothetical protein EOR12_22995 [Mesorhizobium sp.]